MNTFNQKSVSERFSKLPETVQDIILSEETTESIRRATEKAGIKANEKRECIEQITLVSVGLSTTKEFHEYVSKILRLPGATVETFEHEVRAKIFEPIKKALLERLQESRGTKEVDGRDQLKKTEENGSDPYRESVE